MYAAAKALTKGTERYGQGYRAGDFIGMVISLYNIWRSNGIEVVKPDGTKVRITRAKPIDGEQDNFCNLPAFFENPKAGLNVVCKDATLLRILEVQV